MTPTQPAATLSPLPEHRQRALARELSARLHSGASREAVLAEMRAEQTALGVALLDPEFVEQVGTQMLALMGANSHQLMPDAPTYMHQILERRVADTQRTIALLGDAAFVEKAAALKPEEVVAPTGLAPEKREEMIRRLVQEADPEGAEPAIHIASAAIGHRQVHQALAELFKPEGTLAPVLNAALARAWPDASDAQRSQTTANWLNARHAAAVSNVEALAPDGELLREAIARSNTALAKPAAAAIAAPLLASTALNSTKLSQAELEARKNSQHKAEDIIYTLNHAITCLSITDFLIAPFVSSVFGWNICNHSDGHGHGHADHAHHNHAHHDHPPKPIHKRVAAWWNELTSSPSSYLRKHYPGFKEWAIGEAVGDIGAVPLTIAAQRFAPGFMNGIRNFLEPVIGWAFKRSTDKAAREWGVKKGFAPDSQDVVDHAQKLYDYEMRHIPQMAVWTAASVGINYGVMKFRNPGLKLLDFTKGKVAGTAITAGLVLGVRSFTPEGAHKWDETVGKNVIVPISKKVGGLFGIEDSEIDEYHKRQREDRPQGWAARMQLAANSADQAVDTNVARSM